MKIDYFGRKFAQKFNEVYKYVAPLLAGNPLILLYSWSITLIRNWLLHIIMLILLQLNFCRYLESSLLNILILVKYYWGTVMLSIYYLGPILLNIHILVKYWWTISNKHIVYKYNHEYINMIDMITHINYKLLIKQANTLM